MPVFVCTLLGHNVQVCGRSRQRIQHCRGLPEQREQEGDERGQYAGDEYTQDYDQRRQADGSPHDSARR